MHSLKVSDRPEADQSQYTTLRGPNGPLNGSCVPITLARIEFTIDELSSASDGLFQNGTESDDRNDRVPWARAGMFVLLNAFLLSSGLTILKAGTTATETTTEAVFYHLW